MESCIYLEKAHCGGPKSKIIIIIKDLISFEIKALFVSVYKPFFSLINIYLNIHKVN